MRTPTIRPGIDRERAMALAAAEGHRFLAVLEQLDEDQWSMPTECKPWTVRETATHVLGNHEALRSLRSRVREVVRARFHGGNLVDALSAQQIADRDELAPADVVERFRVAIGVSIDGRRALGRLNRAVRLTVPMHQGDERWSMSYLEDIIYTRDTWMHRMDICRAVGAEPELTADHDGVIVADIVREWALRHGQPYRLTLTGAAGGIFESAEQGQLIELDAVEFCRLLSGRGDGDGLLAVEVGY